MQELRVKLSLDLRDWRHALDSAAKYGPKAFGPIGKLAGKSSFSGTIQSAMDLGAVFKFVGLVGLKVFGSLIAAAASLAKTIVSAIGEAISFVAGRLWGLAKVGAGVGLALGAALAAGLHAAFANAKELINQRAQTGVGVGSLSVLGGAAEATGMNPQSLATEINRLQSSLSGVDPESKKAQDALKALGLDLKTLREQSPEEQLLKVGEALRQLKNPADKAGVVMDLFSKKGFEMLAFLNQAPEVIEEATEQAGKLPAILEKDAGAFAFLARAIEGFRKYKVGGFFAGIGDGLRDQLTYFAEKISRLDFVSVGQRLGKALGGAIDVFIGLWNSKTITIGGFLLLGLKAAFAESAAFGKAAWSQLGEPLKVVILDALAVVKEALIYGFEMAAPTMAKILGGVVGAAFGAAKNVDGMIEKAVLQKNIKTDQENIAKYQAGQGGQKWFRDAMISANQNEIGGYQKRIGEIDAARKTNISASATAGAEWAEGFARDNVPKPDSTALKSSNASILNDLKKLFGAGAAFQFTPGQTEAAKAFAAETAKLQAQGAGGRGAAGRYGTGDAVGEKEITPAGGRGARGHESTDQFSRVGLFASKVTASGIDHMQRIAEYTLRSANALEKLVHEHGGKVGAGTGAKFG